MKLAENNSDLYTAETIELEFDLDRAGEEARLTTIVAFCRTHRIYFSLASEYFDENVHRSRKLLINKSLRITDLEGNRTNISVDPTVLAELDELIAVLVDQSKHSDLAIFYRFKTVDLNGFIAHYNRAQELLGDRFHLKYLAKHYNWADSMEMAVFEIEFKDTNDILKLKLVHTTLAEAFNVEFNR